MISTTRFKARRLFQVFVLLLSGCTVDGLGNWHGPAPTSVKVERETGDYSVTWGISGRKLDGSLHQKVSEPVVSVGNDQVGNFTREAFNWDDGGPLSAEIRAYADRRVVLICETSKSARPKPPAAFPSVEVPATYHRFGYKNTVFSPPMFSGGESAGPRMFFDDAGHAFIISPADNFMTSEIKTDGDKVESQFNSQLENLPAGFTHSTLLVEGDTIHEAWDNWGKAMTDLTGKHRPANDSTVELNKIGYWTDNGASYYYKYDPQRGYEGTMLDIAAAYKKLNISLGYLQLDSWWYIKSTTAPNGKPGGKSKNSKLPEGSWNCYGGLMEYTAHPFLFPNGLADFDKQLGMPLVTHNRWIDRDSAYHQNYKISGIAAVDPKWWDHIADYLKTSGVEVYEQDWLNEIYYNSPEFRTTTWAGDAFMDNMARATKERGQRMQYCMELPQHYLQGSKYDNLTSVRVSLDRFLRTRWEPMLYVSQMASSLGEWPWVDTFNSEEKANLILATLTAGPVGFGDDMAKINAANIATCARADGVIVKPDTSIVPLDRTYLSDATTQKAPMIAAAYTEHGPHRTAYVFCYPRNADQMNIEFSPADLGYQSDVWIYEPATGKGQSVSATGSFTAKFADPAAKTAWSYFVIAPINNAGIALIGDTGKIATAGKQRISGIEEKADGVSAIVTFVDGEKAVTLGGYSAKSPTVTTSGGTAEPVKFDSAANQFSVAVSPARGSLSVQVQISSK